MACERAEQIIRGVMYGAPGEDHDSASGRRLLLGVLEWMGLSALADRSCRPACRRASGRGRARNQPCLARGKNGLMSAGPVHLTLL